jgi:hypothetical protein
MNFLKIMNTRLTTKITPFIKNGIFRYSHHLHYPEDFYFPQKMIINLLGDRKSVDTASWEINTFAQEKSLNTSNIVYYDEMLKNMIRKNNFLNFIVNRCYDISCHELLLLNENIINTNQNWKLYNLYVIPYATNRFTTRNFIQNCKHIDFIIYPLAAPKENKRRDINILICNNYLLNKCN